MDFKDLIEKRRSIRKFTTAPVERELIDSVLRRALTAPSARNSRTTRFIAVDDPAVIAQMAQMRDYGSAFISGAPVVVAVAGDTSKSDLWRENGAIAATLLQLACVDAGLASCWVHVNGRPRCQEQPGGEQAIDLLRRLLPLPRNHDVLCLIAIGYSDFEPKPLPPFDAEGQIDWLP